MKQQDRMIRWIITGLLILGAVFLLLPIWDMLHTPPRRPTTPALVSIERTDLDQCLHDREMLQGHLAECMDAIADLRIRRQSER